MSLFADDVLLPITNPLTTLPAIQTELSRYERASGFKINLTKSFLLNLNLPAGVWDQGDTTSPFSCVTREITFLGIQLTPRISDLYKANFPPLLRQLKKDMKR